MRELLIIGTGGFAREVYWHAKNSLGFQEKFIIKGFLEGNVPCDYTKYQLLPLPVLSNVIDYKPEPNDAFVCAIANSNVKEKIVKIISDKSGYFMNLIHQTALVSEFAEVGDGVIFCQNTSISCNTKIGNHVMLNAYTSVGHDAEIGDYSSIMGHVSINGNVKVGTHTFWGCGAKALPDSKIGNHAVVGAGSVVLKKVKEGKTVFGIPAMEI